MKNKRLLIILLGVALILLILFILQLTIGTGVDGEGFNWKLGDFVVAGALLLGTGLVYEFLAKKVKTTKHRVILGIVLLAILFLIWAELAVGLFGTPWAGT